VVQNPKTAEKITAEFPLREVTVQVILAYSCEGRDSVFIGLWLLTSSYHAMVITQDSCLDLGRRMTNMELLLIQTYLSSPDKIPV
jgi:hypothetical protein